VVSALLQDYARTEEGRMMRRIIGGKLQCTRCGETKPLAAFDVRKRGYPQSWCKRCKNAQSTIYKRRSRAAEKVSKPWEDHPPAASNQKPLRAVGLLNNDEETSAILRAKLADREFKLRMLAARNDQRENFIIGVVG
jgi:hypothetical protein